MCMLQILIGSWCLPPSHNLIIYSAKNKIQTWKINFCTTSLPIHGVQLGQSLLNFWSMYAWFKDEWYHGGSLRPCVNALMKGMRSSWNASCAIKMDWTHIILLALSPFLLSLDYSVVPWGSRFWRSCLRTLDVKSYPSCFGSRALLRHLSLNCSLSVISLIAIIKYLASLHL